MATNFYYFYFNCINLLLCANMLIMISVSIHLDNYFSIHKIEVLLNRNNDGP